MNAGNTIVYLWEQITQSFKELYEFMPLLLHAWLFTTYSNTVGEWQFVRIRNGHVSQHEWGHVNMGFASDLVDSSQGCFFPFMTEPAMFSSLPFPPLVWWWLRE